MASESGGLLPATTIDLELVLIPFKETTDVKYPPDNSELEKLHCLLLTKIDALKIFLDQSCGVKLTLIDKKHRSNETSDSESGSSEDENDFHNYGQIILKMTASCPDELKKFQQLICANEGSLDHWLMNNIKLHKILFKIDYQEEYFRRLLRKAKRVLKKPCQPQVSGQAESGTSADCTSQIPVYNSEVPSKFPSKSQEQCAAENEPIKGTMHAAQSLANNSMVVAETIAECTQQAHEIIKPAQREMPISDELATRCDSANVFSTQLDVQGSNPAPLGADNVSAKSSGVQMLLPTDKSDDSGKKTEEFLPTFLDESEWNDLDESSQQKYTLYEFRLCLPDMFDYLYKQQFRTAGAKQRKQIVEVAMGHLIGSMPTFNVSLVLWNEKLQKLSPEIPVTVCGLEYYCLPAWQRFIKTDMVEFTTFKFTINGLNRKTIDFSKCSEFEKLKLKFSFLERFSELSFTDFLTHGKSDVREEKRTTQIVEKKDRKLNSGSFVQFAVFGSSFAAEKSFFSTVQPKYLDHFAYIIYAFCCQKFKPTKLCDSAESIYIHIFSKTLKHLLKDLKDESTKKITAAAFISTFSHLMMNPQIETFFSLSDCGKSLLAIFFIRILSMLRVPATEIPLEPIVSKCIIEYLNAPHTLSLLDAQSGEDNFLKCLDHPECMDTILSIFRAAKFSMQPSFFSTLGSLHSPHRMGAKFVAIVSECLQRIKKNLTDDLLIEFCCLVHKNGFDLAECDSALLAYAETEGKARTLLDAAQKYPNLDPVIANHLELIFSEKACKDAMDDLRSENGLMLEEILKRVKVMPGSSLSSDGIEIIQRSVERSLKNYSAYGEPANLAVFSFLIQTPGVLNESFAIRLSRGVLEKKSKFRTVFVKNFEDGPICVQLKETSQGFGDDLIGVLFSYLVACKDEDIKPPHEAISGLINDSSDSNASVFHRASLEAYEKFLMKQRLEKTNLEDIFSSPDLKQDVLSVALHVCANRICDEDCNVNSSIKEFFLEQDVVTKKNLQHNEDTARIMIETFRDCFRQNKEVETQIDLLMRHRHIWQWVGSSSDENLAAQLTKEAQCSIENTLTFLKKVSDFSLTASDFSAFKAGVIRDEHSEEIYECIDSIKTTFFQQTCTQSTKKIVEEAQNRIAAWESQKNVLYELLHFLAEMKSSFEIELADFEQIQEKFHEFFKADKDKNVCEMVPSLMFETFGIDVKLVSEKLEPNELLQSALFYIFFKESIEEFSRTEVEKTCSEFWRCVLPKAVGQYKQFFSETIVSDTATLQQADQLAKKLELNGKTGLQEAIEVNFADALSVNADGIKIFCQILQRHEWVLNFRAILWLSSSFLTIADSSSSEAHSNALEILQNYIELSSIASTAVPKFLSLHRQIPVIIDINDNIWLIIRNLYDVKNGLLRFLREQKNSDFQQLMDCANETSGLEVSFSTVNSLIILQRALKQLLSLDRQSSLQDLIISVRESIGFFQRHIQTRELSEDTATENLVKRLQECEKHINAIRQLHSSVGSHGETTKKFAAKFIRSKHDEVPVEIKINVAKFIELDIFSSDSQDSMSDGSARFQKETASAADNDSVVVILDNRRVTLEQLIEHRSRILMTMSSTYFESSETPNENESLKIFVSTVDLLENVYCLFHELREAGHQDFSVTNKRLPLSEISALRECLEEKLNTWNTFLQRIRSKYLYANFLFGVNMIKLIDFFSKNSRNETLTNPSDIAHILAFLNVRLVEHEPCVVFDECECLETRVQRIFEYLKNNTQQLSREPQNFGNFENIKELSVQSGKLFLAPIDPRDKEAIAIFLNVWTNSERDLPLSSEVLFCSPETTSIEVILSLSRARELPKRTFFFLETQNLKQKVLADFIAEIGRQKEEKTLGRVAVFCKATVTHTLFTTFPDDIVRVKAITSERLKALTRSILSNVYFCSSNRPCIGKTNVILQQICKSSSFVYVHISGNVKKEALIRTLSTKQIKSDCAIHLDVGWVDNPDALELIIFEALLCNSLVSSNDIVLFNPKAVYIEIANSINSKLEDSFTFLSQVGELKIEWNGMDDFLVSKEPLSPVQVVCQYLKCLNKNSLDTFEINFDSPLPPSECTRLLKQLFLSYTQQYCDRMPDLSFSLLENCLKLMSNQLKKFFCSDYFKLKNLRHIFGPEKKTSVRSEMVKFIIDSTVELTVKSLGAVQEQQTETSNNIYERSATRFLSMLNWESSAHVMPVFQKQNTSAVELVFREIDKVPEDLKNMFEACSPRPLEEFSDLTETELLDRLIRVAAKGSPGDFPELSSDLMSNYRLTADNFLKMILISLRVDSDVPVLIMGETGCGKTSLIRFLAEVQGTELVVMNFHAGVTEKDIRDHVQAATSKAKESLKLFYISATCDGIVWLFLDEINTCEHLGLLKEVICHKRFHGESLPPNLRLLAACNPYVLRSKKSACTAGFETNELREDEMKSLVYRVHPLPESMVQLVWDFGRLTDHDERVYIHKILSTSFSKIPFSDYGQPKLTEIIDCISESQKFVRLREESDYATSLRDVRRFSEFYHFFTEFLGRWKNLDPQICDQSLNLGQRSFLLSLYICYYVRQSSSSVRCEYLEKISRYFYLLPDDLRNEIGSFETCFINRMKLPAKTAVNLALRENVFILFCCIYTKVPVFLVGKPGCSKSLAVSVIRSNFRGKDSEDALFEQYPALSFCSFQGSEASTSEGIKNIFETAHRKLKTLNESNVAPVVLIDEIGLAEKSRHNPLKVLHGLLEPQSSLDCKCDVAVIGISNWALDPAKMNRAIHISRPDMTEEELYCTGKAISSSVKRLIAIDDDDQRKIARACHEYLNKRQPFGNFHGLRDFYYLLKFLSEQNYHTEEEKSLALKEGLARNFNGLSLSHESALDIFQKLFPDLSEVKLRTERHKSVTETMILKNLREPSARHLMLIYESESCLDLLCRTLTKEKRKFRVMHGSSYDQDQYSEEFTFRKLNEVIMCMEEGIIVIFKDFELLYGSLYDMLNQNYSEYANKKYCRIAMGTKANQNCVVHDKFRCIVLVSKTTVQDLRQMDPPFLNRFEKQPFSIKATVEALGLTSAFEKLDAKLNAVRQLNFSDCKVDFKKSETFLGYYNDLGFCYLIDYSDDMHRNESMDHAANVVFKRFEQHMLPESVLRCTFSKLTDHEKANLQNEYFNQSNRLRNSSFFDIINEYRSDLSQRKDQICKLYIYTKSSLYTRIELLETQNYLADLTITDIRLMDFVRESSIINEFTDFFRQSDGDGLLIVRIKPSIDECYIVHARCLLDDICQQYRAECKRTKLVVFLVHLQREDLELKTDSWKWSPLLDWQVHFAECLFPEVQFGLSDLVLNKHDKFIADNMSSLFKIFRMVVPEALAQVLRKDDEIKSVLRFFKSNEACFSSVEKFILREYVLFEQDDKKISPFDPNHWVISLSMETTRLSICSSFHDFVLSAIKEKLRIRATTILQALCHYSFFKADNWDASMLEDLFPRILNYLISEEARQMELEPGVKFQQLHFPYSHLVYSVLRKIFCQHGLREEKCKTEMKNFLAQLGFERFIQVSDPIEKDFIELATFSYCGQDRSESLYALLEHTLKKCADFIDVVFAVLSCFNETNSHFPEMLNVHAYLQQRNVDCIRIETDDLREAWRTMLEILIPSDENFSNLGISSLNEWRKIVSGLLSLLRSKQHSPSFLFEIEYLLMFFKLFAPSGRNISAAEVIRTYEYFKEHGLLLEKDGILDSKILIEWKRQSVQLFRDAEAPSEEIIVLIEANYYYTLLQTSRLTEPLLVSLVDLLVDGRLPIGFVSCVWTHITTNDDDENTLFTVFAERIEAIKDAGLKADLYSILATTFKPGRQTTSDLLISLESLRPQVKSTLDIQFVELVDLVDAVNFFSEAAKDATVVQNKLICFSHDQPDVFAFLEKCLLTQKMHPLWLLFVRCLRQHYTLGEMLEFLNSDHVTSIIPSISRNYLLQFGQNSDLAPYCLCYPFLDIPDKKLYDDAVTAFRSVLVPGRPDYSLITKMWSRRHEMNERRVSYHLISIYIESILFKKCSSRFQSPEKALTRFMKEHIFPTIPDELHHLGLVALNEKDSCVDEANLTNQSSPASLCLATMYYRVLISFLVNWPPQPGSVVDELRTRDAPTVADGQKCLTKKLFIVRNCACSSVSIYKAEMEESSDFEYNCAFCGSEDKKFLSEVKSSNCLSTKQITGVVDDGIELLISLHRFLWLDIQRGVAKKQTDCSSLSLLCRLESLAKQLNLSTEDCTWVIHEALRSSAEHLFHRTASAGLEAIRCLIARCLSRPQSVVAKFKRDRLNERGLQEPFSYACIIDGVRADEEDVVSHLDNDQEDNLPIARQLNFLQSPLLFPKHRCNPDTISRLLDCYVIETKDPDETASSGHHKKCSGRLLQLVLQNKTLLAEADCLLSMANWHSAVTKKIDGHFTLNEFEACRVADFIQKYPETKPAHEMAQTAWQQLQSIDGSGRNPLSADRPLQGALFTELSQLSEAARPRLERLNEFLIDVAGLALYNECEALSFNVETYCHFASTEFLAHPNRLPTLSDAKLVHLSEIFASYTSGRDIYVDWGLLETAIFREVLLDKCFVRLLPWEPRFAQAEQRSLAVIINAFRTNCRNSDTESVCLSEAEKHFVQQHQQRDSGYARRLAEFCRVALSYAHRCLAEISNAEDSGFTDVSFGDFLDTAAENGALPPRSTWPQLPFSTSLPKSTAASSEISSTSSLTSLLEPTPLSRLVALLEAAELELFGLMLPDLRRQRQGRDAASETSAANRLAELVPQECLAEALRWLRLICVRHFVASAWGDSTIAMTAAEALSEPAHRPTGTSADCLAPLLGNLGNAPLTLLLPICEAVEKIMDSKKPDPKKYSKILNRIKR